MKPLLGLAAGIAIGAAGMFGWQQFAADHNSRQPYAGQETRQASTLSDDDVRQLLAGQGWGLAKPAEFNGYPGPRHVLDAARELELTADQKQQVQAAFDAMAAKARLTGVKYIEAESAVDEAFKSGLANAENLRERIARAEMLRAKLREVHLSAHLEIAPALNEQQKRKYVELRGYGGNADHAH